MIYPLVRNLLFLLPPETAHTVSMKALHIAAGIPSLMNELIARQFQYKKQDLSSTHFGLHFPNPVGLGAGFDKNAEHLDVLELLGFGFVEIGTVTPKGQLGNPKPRMLRLPSQQALINRMGFNNEGLEAMKKRLLARRSKVIVGGNLGKNKVTPNEQAEEDYCLGFEALYDVVDYFVVNVSSPNTPNLRALQEKEPLKKLLVRLQDLNGTKPALKPILLKIAPDLTNEQLDDVIEIVLETQLAGVIATNTTLSREGLLSSETLRSEMGGLSGKPLTARSTEVIRYLHQKSKGQFPIVGVGGIHSAEDAVEKLKAGASLVQIYTGFIYEGPGLIRDINRAIVENGL